MPTPPARTPDGAEGASPADHPPTVAVILAAGAGSRYDGRTHKLLARLGGTSIVERCVATALASGIGPVVVVTGSIDLAPEISAGPTVSIVHNPEWRDGQATSLMAAIDVAEQLGAVAIVVGLGDQPLITADAWRAVANSTAAIAVASYDGLARNPVRLHRSVWPLLDRTGDEGARTLIRLRPDLVEAVPCTGSAADVDTRDDLKSLEEQLRWQSRSSTNSP